VVARYLCDLTTRRFGNHAERIPRALDDERGDGDGVELGKAARGVATPGRAEREGETEDAQRARLCGRSTRHPRTQRPSADDQRQFTEGIVLQVADDGCPGRIELVRGRRRAATGDAVRLLDERYLETVEERRFRHGDQVSRPDASAGPMAEHQSGSRRLDGMEVDVRRPVRGRDLHHADAVGSTGFHRDPGCHALSTLGA
jgi:hypothetical protein